MSGSPRTCVSWRTLPNVTILPCDVASDDQINTLFATIEDQVGGLDFLVHGVAFAQREDLAAPFADVPGRLSRGAGHQRIRWLRWREAPRRSWRKRAAAC
jgi:NAD(P)-dependent dehydrogenase (short-subunit alcohol dehydrogenase family)